MLEHPKRCPACDRPVQAVRFGVPFTQLKAAIIDKIKSRNGARIHAREIFPGTSQHTMRAHIYQINEKLMDTEWRIDGTMGIYGGYRIVKRGMAGRGVAWRGTARQGTARPGTAGPGAARSGEARRDAAWRGNAR